MPKTRADKATYLADRKRKLVLKYGCSQCGKGGKDEGFTRFWSNGWTYNARRFVFKYTDPKESDVPVAQLPKYRETSKESIDAALARCVILCRTCADPRQARKDDQCKREQTTSDSPTGSSKTGTTTPLPSDTTTTPGGSGPLAATASSVSQTSEA